MSTSDTMKICLFPPLKNRFCFLKQMNRRCSNAFNAISIRLSTQVVSECLRAKYWCFCSSKSMSIANALLTLLLLLLLLKRHERSECHSLWFCLWFSFLAFKKLLKTFRPSTDLTRHSFQTLKKYKRQVLKYKRQVKST